MFKITLQQTCMSWIKILHFKLLRVTQSPTTSMLKNRFATNLHKLNHDFTLQITKSNTKSFCYYVRTIYSKIYAISNYINVKNCFATNLHELNHDFTLQITKSNTKSIFIMFKVSTIYAISVLSMLTIAFCYKLAWVESWFYTSNYLK